VRLYNVKRKASSEGPYNVYNRRRPVVEVGPGVLPRRVLGKSQANPLDELSLLEAAEGAGSAVPPGEFLLLEIGIQGKHKAHRFDLGSDDPKIIVECKSHKWTESQNMPSAKMMAWTEAMYYFLAAPKDYRKIFFVLKDVSAKHHETLAQYYLRTYDHMIPDDVEFWEYDEQKKIVEIIRQRKTPLSEGMGTPTGVGREDGSTEET
jgi:hypothetical protein